MYVRTYVCIACIHVVYVIGHGVDIDSNRRDIIFRRGRQNRNINIPINDDDIFEPLESVRLSIRIPQDFRGLGISLGLNSEAIGNIIDDEGISMCH